ncbi:MAG: hypothetical protein R2911_09835 [Caldilineaceae bacterium]
MVIFPAGGISTSTGLIGPVTDLEWKLFFTKLIQMTEATVAPIYFYGHNSCLFQVISQFSETLRLSLIVRVSPQQKSATRCGWPLATPSRTRRSPTSKSGAI